MIDGESRRELIEIDGYCDEAESRFGGKLEFGTAGLRGIMGAGTYRMNVYTVCQATKALAMYVNKYINKNAGDGSKNGVIIAYDSRNNSRIFAEAAACTLVECGIKVYLFDDIRPTPELSFALQHLNCAAGINITASHNTKEYNGYKVFWSDGAQIMPSIAAEMAEMIDAIDPLESVFKTDFASCVNSGMVQVIGDEIDERYIERVLNTSLADDNTKEVFKEMKMVYTPLHGAGYKLVPAVLKRLGLSEIYTVESQMIPDGDFPTVESPNPENAEAFAAAIELAKGLNVDLITGTDPDCDRVGALYRNKNGEYTVLSGNQIGILLLDYVIQARKNKNNLPEDAFAVKTVVTSFMADAICEMNGVRCDNVYTGFKNIGEKIADAEACGYGTFIFGYEESHGYLGGTYAKDKDGAGGVMLLAEAAAYHRVNGRSVEEALLGLYENYGHYAEKTVSRTITGLKPIQKMKEIMEKLRSERISMLDGESVESVIDYLNNTRTYTDGRVESINMQPSDILAYILKDGTRAIIRPSGTEPKVKFYILTKASVRDEAVKRINRIEEALNGLIAD